MEPDRDSRVRLVRSARRPAQGPIDDVLSSASLRGRDRVLKVVFSETTMAKLKNQPPLGMTPIRGSLENAG